MNNQNPENQANDSQENKRLANDPRNQNPGDTTKGEHGGNRGGDEKRAERDAAGSSSRGDYPGASQRNQGGGQDTDGNKNKNS